MMPNLFVPLANHLWQSTLFAAAMALLALALRHNQARVRYWLWAAASYKFLLHFSWLVSLGHRFEWHAAPRVMSSALSVHLADAVSGPLFLTSSFPPASVTAARPPAFLLVMGILWACGFAAVSARWALAWLRIRAVMRAASPLALGLPIRVVSTAARLEPGVFGIFRPVLVLPEGIAGRLTETQLRAIFAHELCHVRRRDNLTAALHMLVEALFWFHPLVWWLGARMVDERERACDEEVLQAGSHAQAYAESILKVCEFYLESPLRCVSGVTGSDLKKRIQRIMKERFGVALSARKKWLLATVGVAVLALPVVVGMLTAPRLQAQDSGIQFALSSPTSGRPSFDVASIKLNKSSDTPHWNIALGPGDFMRPVGGLFSVSNEPLTAYIAFAYKLADNIKYLMPGLPNWTDSEHFDIEARAAGTPKKDEFRLMMQSLLADRFKLAMHHETRQAPVFALVLAKPGKPGPQLMPHTDEATCLPTPNGQQPFPSSAAVPLPPLFCGAIGALQPGGPGRMRIGGRKIPLQLIASFLVGVENFDRPIVDRTGLNGTVDFWLEATPQFEGPPPPGFQPDPNGPTLQEALQEQLGLKLESQMAPVDVMVVDHIEEPSAN